METYTAIIMTGGAVIVIGVALLLILVRASQRDREALAAMAAPGAAVPEPKGLDESAYEQAPLGTFALLLIYILVIVLTWGYTFTLLIRRG